MKTELEAFFKDTPLGIKSVLQGAVFLAEKVNSRMDLSGKEKTQLVVKSMVEFLGEGRPELVALVEAVVPGMLEIVISTARGKYMLKQVTACLPPGLCGLSGQSALSSLSSSAVKVSTASTSAAADAPKGVTQDPANEVSAATQSVWAWVRSPFFRSAPAPVTQGASPASASADASNETPVTTIREPVAA